MSRFVSGGTGEEPTERSEEWLKAQQAVEAKQLQKKLEGQQEGGKSLYETLQANKAAKEDAFQESIKLKNQFRALDDDEIDFLESVNETTRARESAVRKETAEQLNHFREQQQKSERSAQIQAADEPREPRENWSVTRKRKRDKIGHGPAAVKLRKSSSTIEAEVPEADGKDSVSAKSSKTAQSKRQDEQKGSRPPMKPNGSPISPPAQAKESGIGRLGLADYSSDDE